MTTPASTTPATPTTTGNSLADMVVSTIQTLTDKANSIVTKIMSSTADTKTLVHDIRNDPTVTDAEVKEFQEWLEKATAAILARQAKVDAHIVADLLPAKEEIDVDALTTEYKGLRTDIKAATRLLSRVDGFDADAYTPPDLKSLRGGTVSGGSGTGVKRPRVADIYVNGKSVAKEVPNKDGSTRTVANFTFAAQAISKLSKSKVEVKDLQAAAFEAAKTDDFSTLNGQEFTFYFESGEGESRINAEVVVFPNDNDAADAKSETPAGSADDSADDTAEDAEPTAEQIAEANADTED